MVEAQDDQMHEDTPSSGGFWGTYGQKIMIGGIAAYLLLLFIGVIAELFDIQSILDWWIWRPPGKGPAGPPN
ncbi:MAG: hypothetical protein KAR83_05875 [Thermodesulfovibrionales bacterium]|nr:hypothetical protein [Thermodesulfovibrionales bacterium]